MKPTHLKTTHYTILDSHQGASNGTYMYTQMENAR